MDKPYAVISFGDSDRIDDNGKVTRNVEVVFRVGTMGPFRVLVPKTDNWELAMQTAIDNEVRRVKTIAG